MTETTIESPLTHREVVLIITGIIVAMFIAALDQTIVVTALPSIGRALGQSTSLPWIVTAYLLAGTAITPLYGKVSDIIGRRTTLLFALSVFMLGSVACAIAPTMLILIAARALQGLGGGGLISLAQTIIADIVSPKERSRYQVYISGVYMTASVLGPLFGGFLSEHLHWSAIFWLNVPLCLLALLMTNGLLKKLPRHERPHKLDFLGAGLMASGSIAFLLALNWGGVRYAWGSPQILGTFALALVLWFAFAIRLRTAEEPFLPPEILQNKVVATGIMVALLIMGCYIGVTAYLPIYMELAYGFSASASGVALIPFMGGTVVGAIIAGRFMARSSNYKQPGIVGLIVSIIVTAILAFSSSTIDLVVFEFFTAVISIGLGTIFPITTVAIQNAVIPHQMGTATGVMNFFRSIGGALVVALFGAVLFSQLPNLTTLETAHNLAANPEIHQAFRPLFGLAAAILAVALLVFAFMPQNPLRTTNNNSHQGEI